MKEIRKPAPPRMLISYLLAVLPLLLLVMVFLLMNSAAAVTDITRQELGRGIVQVLTAVTVGLMGILVR
jgi:hypothetical protein